MHQERDPHPHPHPHPWSAARRTVVSWVVIALILAAAAFLVLRRDRPGSEDGRAAAPDTSSPGDRALAAIFREGVSALEQYDYLAAYRKFAQVARERPGWEAAHFNAGLAALNFRKDETTKEDYIPIAEREFLETLRINPRNLHARFSLGVLYKHDQKNDKAFESFEAVAKADPSDPFVLYEYGAMLADRNRHEDAREALEKAVRLQPAFASALYKLMNVVYRATRETEKMRKALDDFRALKDRKEDITNGVKYGEAGKYMMAIPDPSPLRRSDGAPLATALPSGPATGAIGEPAAVRMRSDGTTAPPAFAMSDLDGDGILDLVLCGQPGGGGAPAQTQFWKGGGSGTAFTKAAGLEADGAACALGDLDGDGDLDLVLAEDGILRVFDNDGKAGFTPTKLKFPEAKPGFPVRALVLDADADWDLDLLVVRQVKVGDRIEASIEILCNNREGSFSDLAATAGIARLPAPVDDVLFADLDGDIDMDLLFLLRPRTDCLVLLNDRAWRYRRFPAKDLGGLDSLLSRAGLDPSVGGALLAGPASDAQPFSMVGFADSAGRPHVFLAKAGARAEVIPAGAAPVTWIGIDLEGKKSPEPGLAWANLSGIGSIVEMKFGDPSSVRQVNGAGAGGGSGPYRLWYDLAGAAKVDYARILWPDSVLQSEPGLEAGKIHRIDEKQRKPTSCPLVFAWDGEGYRYVGDYLGVGGLGYLETPGFYSRPDPTEVIELPEMRPVEGELRISILEPLEECAYLDRVSLAAADCPPGVRAHPEEMFAARGPAPAASILAYREALLPERVLDEKGRDVTEALRAVDRTYAEGWRKDHRFPGVAESHAIVLEYGRDLPAGSAGAFPRPYLLLHGYVEYSYSTSNFAAAQARVTQRAPTVSVERDGKWVVIRDEWGFPGGTPRWMAVDLGGALGAGDRRLKVETDMEIYFDHAFVALAEPIGLGGIGGGGSAASAGAWSGVRTTALGPARAELGYRGFPRYEAPDGKHPKLYEYESPVPEEMKPFPGDYTRYGDVRDLVASADDALAVLGEGDEVLLGFGADLLPPLPDGWTRTFFLSSVGWCKDMDLYTAASDRIEPLPFRSMTEYPPPAGQSPPSEAARMNAERSGRVVEPLVIGDR